MSPDLSAAAELTQLQSQLQAVRAGSLRSATFCQTARACSALLAALPARYGEVWHGVLDRLESSALFSEESCSFSQHDLLDSLQQWLDHAREQLARTAGG